MAVGFILTALALAGLITGLATKRRALVAASAIALVAIAAVWLFFSRNPY